MKCSQCKHYSYGLRRCELGKCNPKTKKNVEDTARTMGWGYICHLNPHKQNMLNKLIDELNGK